MVRSSDDDLVELNCVDCRTKKYKKNRRQGTGGGGGGEEKKKNIFIVFAQCYRMCLYAQNIIYG